MEENMFVKIVKDTTVVDAAKTLNYVMENPRNKAVISCEAEQSNGIVSSDGSAIWHLDGRPKFTQGNYDTVKVVEVCEDEYKSIRESLRTGETVSEEVRETLTTAEMMDMIQHLTAEVTELKKQLASK